MATIMINSPKDGSTEEDKIAYLRQRFGEGLAKDLLEAAGSGKIPSVLRDFLQDQIILPDRADDGKLVFTNNLFLSYPVGNWKYNQNDGKAYYDKSCPSNGHEIIIEALIKASATGNQDFLKAFIEYKRSDRYPNDTPDSVPLAMFINGYNTRENKAIPYRMLEAAIENRQIGTLDLLLKNKVFYDLVSVQDSRRSWDNEWTNKGSTYTHNNILNLVTRYAKERPAEVSHILKDERIMGDLQKELARTVALNSALVSLSMQTAAPKINLAVAHARGADSL